MGDLTGPSLIVVLPNAETEVTIGLTVDASEAGQSSTRSTLLTFFPISAEEAAALRKMCQLRRLLRSYVLYTPLLPGSQNRVRGFVDPLWDELPFFRTNGRELTADFVRELLVATQSLSIESADVAASWERVLDRRHRAEVRHKGQ